MRSIGQLNNQSDAETFGNYLSIQKIENQVDYLKSQLRTIQGQLSHQERIFARIEIRRQGKQLLTIAFM